MKTALRTALTALAALALLAGRARRRRPLRQGPGSRPTMSSCPSPPRSPRSPLLRRKSPSRAATTPSSSSSPPTLAGNRLQDLTGDVKYEVGRPQGRPRHHLRPGHPAGQRRHRDHRRPTATRRSRCRSRPRAATSTCRSTSATRSCRSSPSSAATRGGCHGKASGQNGFKLSLLGFEPEVDYNALVKEARGRRVFPAAPDHSLLLLKATGTIAHGGGKTHGGRLRRVQADPPLDRRRHCPSASRPIRSSPRSPSIPSTAS